MNKWFCGWVLATCIASTGCAAMSSGVAKEAGVKYFFGDLQGIVTTDVARTYEVAADVIDGMGLRVEKSGATEIDAEIVAYTARDRKVHLRIDSLGEGETKLSIRIGSLGDESLSLRIYQRIEEDL